MQFPVPQFTEVEDKIIGSLTIKQFGIVFGAGVIVFVAFTLTKSISVLVIACLLFGVPALAVAFIPFNGRPIYNMAGSLFNFLSSPKVLIFHKEGAVVSDKNQKGDKKSKSGQNTVLASQVQATSPQQRLREVNQLLQKQAEEESKLLK